MEIYDIHTHDVSTPDSDEEVPETEITHIINVYPLGFEYAKDNAHCEWFSCGVHPWYSDDAEPQLNFLKEIASDNRIVAIGEAGLDKLKGADEETQKHVFEEQIKLSEKLQKPLIIHCVKAWEQLMLMQKQNKPQQPWIIHGYRGKPELTKQLLNHQFLFSIGEKYNQETVQMIPLDKIFCETDTAEVNISDIYQHVAHTKKITVEELAAQIKENIRKTFPLIIPQKTSEKETL